MGNKTMITMNIRSAVLYVESQINKGNYTMMVNTDFGRVCFEGNTQANTMDPIHPALVVSWEQAPRTFWVLQNKDQEADYYMEIDVYGNESVDHMSIVEGFIRALLMKSGFSNPRDPVVYGMVLSFIDNYDEKKVLISRLTEDYMNCHMSFFNRQNASINLVVTEMFQQKVESGRMIISMGNIMLEQYMLAGKLTDEVFNDEFCKEVYGILLYMQVHNEKKVSDTKQNIVGFTQTALTQSPNAVNK